MGHAPSGVQSKAGRAPRIGEAVVSRPGCIKTGLAQNSHRKRGARGCPGTACNKTSLAQNNARRAARGATPAPPRRPTPEAQEALCDKSLWRETGRGKPKCT
eukprot:5405878-Pyramimonas_sp.AAC.1